MNRRFPQLRYLCCILTLTGLFFCCASDVSDVYSYMQAQHDRRRRPSWKNIRPRPTGKPKNNHGRLAYRGKRRYGRHYTPQPKVLTFAELPTPEKERIHSNDIIKFIKDKANQKQQQHYANAEKSSEPIAWDYEQLQESSPDNNDVRQFWDEFYFHYWAHSSKYYYSRVRLNVRVPVLPEGVLVFALDGQTFHYYKGIYYKGVGHDYQVIPAPMGARVDNIPADSLYLVFDKNVYYYYYGTFYRHDDEKAQFVSVPPPVGIEIPALPKGRETVQKNGQLLYRVGIVLYRPHFRAGKLVYLVAEVG